MKLQTGLKTILLLLNLIHSQNCQNCRVTKENQNFLVLSDKQTDANSAIRTCSSLGGKLAEFTSQTVSNETKRFLRENLIINDNSIFIGARSNASSSEWFWINGTMVNNSNFQPSNKTVCQQMTWPFTYTDGINLRPKKCEEKSYFACLLKFEIEVRPDLANESVLEVSWRFYDFMQITKNANDLYVQIEINGVEKSKVLYVKTPARLFGFTCGTTYNVQAKISSTNCSYSLPVSSVKTVKISFGVIPDPIQSARISNNSDGSSDCFIEWPFIQKEFNDTISYTIFIISDKNRSQIVLNTASLKCNNSLRYFVNLHGYSPNSIIRFKIQAKSCKGWSETTDVSGFCVASPAPSLNGLNMFIVGVSALGFIFVVAFVVGIFIYIKKTTSMQEMQENDNN